MAQADAQLSELAIQMKSTIQGHFVPTLEALKQRFDSSLNDMNDWADDIHDALTDIRERLPHQIHELASAWRNHGQELHEVYGQATDLAQTYQEQTQHAQTSATALQNRANEHVMTLQHSLDAVQELGHNAGEELTQQMTEWMQSIDNTLAEAGQHVDQVEQNMADLGTGFAQGVADVVDKIDQASSSVTEHVSNALDQFGVDLEHMGSEQHNLLLDQVANAIGAETGEVIATVETFLQAGEEMHDLINGEVGKVLKSVQDVNRVLDEIKPVIELAKTLL